MKLLLKNALLFNAAAPTDLWIRDGVFCPSFSESAADLSMDLNGLVLFPGFTDVHVHFREPGFSYKETIASGSRAAARGGYTAVCTMPNLSPVPDSLEHLAVQEEAIEKDACISVYPYGSLTKEEAGKELSDLAQLSGRVCGFSDDGKGLNDPHLMEQAMLIAKANGKLIAAHCEDPGLVAGGVIHDGAYARQNGIPGISSESEWAPIARDLALVKKTGCPYHVCHISTKESVALIRKAKKEGLPVTCETGPHYLLLNDSQLQDEGRFKMNPPIRSEEDRLALIEGLLDGTIDMIATDHAPHSPEEKSKGLRGSLMGIVGIETAFPLLYTHLVRPGILPLEKLVQLLTAAPQQRFDLPGTDFSVGSPADITAFDLNAGSVIDPARFLSKGRATPFAGEKVFGRCVFTLCKGRFAWKDPEVDL